MLRKTKHKTYWIFIRGKWVEYPYGLGFLLYAKIYKLVAYSKD